MTAPSEDEERCLLTGRFVPMTLTNATFDSFVDIRTIMAQLLFADLSPFQYRSGDSPNIVVLARNHDKSLRPLCEDKESVFTLSVFDGVVNRSSVPGDKECTLESAVCVCPQSCVSMQLSLNVDRQ